jgi:hypothetical protein
MPVLGVDYDARDCVENKCGLCQNMKRFQICDAEMALTKPITFLREEVVEYQTQKKDEEGKFIVKKKTDFVSVSRSIGDFMEDLRTRTVAHAIIIIIYIYKYYNICNIILTYAIIYIIYIYNIFYNIIITVLCIIILIFFTVQSRA